MDAGELTGLLAMTLAVGCVATALGGAWALGRLRGQRDTGRLPRGSGEADARLERIEQIVETMAVEVERISEAQRFSAQLLAERAHPNSAPAGDA